MQTHSNLELNALLTSLMEGWDESNALETIKAFHKLPFSRRKILVKSRLENNTSITGHTDEAGDVTVSGKEAKVSTVGERQEEVARVGNFKIKRLELDENTSTIIWQNFWASDIGTTNPYEQPNPIFGVCYCNEGLRPIALIRWDFVSEGNFFGSDWRDYFEYFKILIPALIKGRMPRIYKVVWNAYPTVMFCSPEYTVSS